MDNTTPTKSTESAVQQQANISAQATATRFLNDVSGSLQLNEKQYDYYDAQSDAAARNLLQSIQSNPLKNQILNQVASDMNNNATMSQLGLTGSVERDSNGDVTGLSFTSPSMTNAYQSMMSLYQGEGATPAYASAALAQQNPIADTAEQGHIAFVVNDTSDFNKPQAPAQNGRPSSGVGGITIN